MYSLYIRDNVRVYKTVIPLFSFNQWLIVVEVDGKKVEEKYFEIEEEADQYLIAAKFRYYSHVST